jgi:structural maintenance of chromosome 4
MLDQPGPDAYTIVPNSTLVVTRTAYRNNSSRYTINNKASTFTEVRCRARKRNII